MLGQVPGQKSLRSAYPKPPAIMTTKARRQGGSRPPAAILILNRNGTRGPQSAPGSPEFQIFSTLTTLARSGSEWSQIDLDARCCMSTGSRARSRPRIRCACDELRALRKVSTPGTGSDPSSSSRASSHRRASRTSGANHSRQFAKGARFPDTGELDCRMARVLTQGRSVAHRMLAGCLRHRVRPRTNSESAPSQAGASGQESSTSPSGSSPAPSDTSAVASSTIGAAAIIRCSRAASSASVISLSRLVIASAERCRSRDCAGRP